MCLWLGGRTEIIGGGVWPQYGEPSAAGDGDGEEGRGEGEAAGLVGVGKLKAQLLGVVVDELGAVQLELVEAKARKDGLVGRRGASARVQGVEANAGDGSGDGDLGGHGGGEESGTEDGPEGCSLGHCEGGKGINMNADSRWLPRRTGTKTP